MAKKVVINITNEYYISNAYPNEVPIILDNEDHYAGTLFLVHRCLNQCSWCLTVSKVSLQIPGQNLMRGFISRMHRNSIPKDILNKIKFIIPRFASEEDNNSCIYVDDLWT